MMKHEINSLGILLKYSTLAWMLLLAISLPSTLLGETEPNVVLFFVDDMGWTDWQASATNPNGSPVYETPNLNALASAGVTFSNAYASAPVCSPTRASLMTGKSPAKTRITDWIGAGVSTGTRVRSPANWTQNLAASEVTLAEALKTGGYDTAFFGKWHIGQSGNPGTTPLAHGFNSNVGGTASGNPGFAGGFFAGSDGAWAGMPGLDTPGTYPSSKYLSDALAEKASDYITQSQQGGSPAPFFLTMSHYLVHTPLQAPASLVSKYQTKINTLEQQNVDLKGHNNATYAAMVEKMDESLGMLVSRLEDPNADGNTSDSIRDNTIILFTSDHGGLDTSETFATDNAPLRAGKGSLYEGGTRVPLVVSWTGNSAINSGLASTARSSSHDIYPTLLDLTGVAGDATQNANMDGTSFRAALEGGSFDRGHQFWHYPHTSPQDSGSDIVSGGSFVSSVIKDNWKLIYFYDDPHYELYDLSSDLGESDSVLLANPQVANDLSAALRQHLVGINAQMPIDINTNNPVDAPPALDLNLAGPMFLERFNETVDYQVAGVGNTKWDGLLNPNASTSLASTSGSETLAISSNGRFVANNFNSSFLYKKVSGDFSAVMEIADMDSQNFNVLAMLVADPDSLDQDFLWIGQQDRTGENDFAQSRNIDDGVRLEEVNQLGDYRYYRLTREGDTFLAFVSNDGAVWSEYTTFVRSDLPDEILLGITQGSFSANVANAQVASFAIDLELPGDFNADGTVNQSDLSTWQTNYGLATGAEQSDGDANLDNEIDSSDFLLWQSSFTAIGNTSAVPEPTAAASGVALLWSLLSVRQRGDKRN